MAKRTTATSTTSTIKRETTSAPKRSQRDRGEVEIAPHEVARRAYERFVERGGEHGHDVQDWLAAEAELRAGRG